MFSRNLFVNKSHTFLPNQIESFCKTSKRFAEKHKDFFYKILELLQKSMVRVEKQNNFTRNSMFRAQDLGFGARFWIQGFDFFGFVLRVLGLVLRIF